MTCGKCSKCECGSEPYDEQKALDRAGDEVAREIDREVLLQAGSMMSGGGYSIGTEEGHKQMVRQRCESLVVALVGSELAKKWWTGYNKAFNHTPEAQWELDYQVVHNYLMHHAFVGGGS